MDELFSKRLTELINSTDVTLDKLEQYVGKTNATISRYASGEITGVKRSVIVKLAEYFNVSPAWLAGFSDNKYENSRNSYKETLNKSIQQIYGIDAALLIEYYSKLNNSGKEKAIENIKDLTKINEYTEIKNESQNA